MTDLRYPIGKFSPIANPSELDRAEFLRHIAHAPKNLRAAIDGLSDHQLDTAYRPEGWTLRQVVHHLPDSHLNAYVRCKLALTEENPTIKTYHENLWAELPDARNGSIEPSLILLESLHGRWMGFFRALAPADFGRQMVHPERGPMTIESLAQLYAWHGRHHTAQITATRDRLKW